MNTRYKKELCRVLFLLVSSYRLNKIQKKYFLKIHSFPIMRFKKMQFRFLASQIDQIHTWRSYVSF
jgi:hypothetical protein